MSAARRDLQARAQELRRRAAELAGPIATEAAARTSLACERAVLRLFGVSGRDREGRPLALEVVERFVALGPGRFGGGIALPFAVAALEYDLPPEELALDIAAGNVDLALEAELLSEPERRSDAENAVRRWLDLAWQRFDANRTARAELRGLLGEPPAPWTGADLEPTSAALAAAAVGPLVEGGADLVRVRVPRDGELRRGLGEEIDRQADEEEPSVAPAGSQRGLALLRTAIDEASTEAERYVRLATRALGLAAPDQAVVAGFERVDLLDLDPIASIVEYGIDPSRAFTDQLFALRLLARSGATLALGPGPLAVAPELSRGEPIGSATRSGRALAMQALDLEFSLLAELPAERIFVGALPADLLGAPSGIRAGLAEVELRRLVFPGHGLVFEEPETATALAGWPSALTAWCAGGPAPALVLRRATATTTGIGAAEVRAAAEAAAWLATSRRLGPLAGDALAGATRSLDVALQTLEDLAAQGWEPLLGATGSQGAEAGAGAAGGRRDVGASGLVERRQYFDPFEALPRAGPIEAPSPPAVGAEH
ncbi:MAG TPA: lysine 5,6-aminomutase subunit alpha [Candidatus Limnocylindrales bacterium]|nr:lysine 5,6-aminomutase subunit alpha [Candidatus Limnocylindrales bacterium]